MNMILNLGSNVLVVPPHSQTLLLSLLATCPLYVPSSGWGDATYTVSKEVPKIEYVTADKLLGDAEALKEVRAELEEKRSDYYKMYVGKNAAEKELKDLKEKYEALSSVVTTAAESVAE